EDFGRANSERSPARLVTSVSSVVAGVPLRSPWQGRSPPLSPGGAGDRRAAVLGLAVFPPTADNCGQVAPTFSRTSSHAGRARPTPHRPAARRPGRRRRRGGPAAGRRLRPTAPAGPRPHGPPAPRPEPAADRPGPRGLPAPDRQGRRLLGVPAALLLRRRPGHARHP